jgi:hypothetical protein
MEIDFIFLRRIVIWKDGIHHPTYGISTIMAFLNGTQDRTAATQNTPHQLQDRIQSRVCNINTNQSHTSTSSWLHLPSL